MRKWILSLLMLFCSAGIVLAQGNPQLNGLQWAYYHGVVTPSTMDQVTWTSVQKLSDIPNPPSDQPQIISYKTVIENVDCLKCALFLGTYVRAYEIYIDQNLYLKKNGGTESTPLELGKPKLIIPLSEAKVGQTLLIITNQTFSSAKLNDDFMFGEMTDLYAKLLAFSQWTIIIGLMVFITAIFAGMLYLTALRERTILFLSICAINVGIFLISRATVLQDQWGLTKTFDFLEYFTFSMIPLFFTLYSKSVMKTIKWAEYIVYGSTALLLLKILFSYLFNGLSIFEEIDAMRLVFLLNFFMIIINLIYSYRSGGRESRIMISIFLLTVSMSATLNVLESMGISNPDLIALAGGFFMISQLFILIHRFMRIDRERTTYMLELEAANQKLQEMNQVKDSILANTSHELRTPLHGMIGLAESLLGDPRNQDSTIDQNLKLIISSGNRLNHLINDILDYSKMRKHEIELFYESVAVLPIIERIYQIQQVMISGKPIQWINRISKLTPNIKADEMRLEQIFYNLIGNAFKFTEHGHVIIESEWSDQAVTFSIQDSGIGIAEEDQARIFESFEQAETSDIRKFGGTGLGLAITKSLVELHQGSISVSSVAGEGSVFKVTFPRS